ncbi:hypothetical protein [uncultured Roseobacter sp.]|uniref:calcium-binding protein n=1 Tax=uncultured Roseobacter sp. TaxID=114847 RepID=UPI00262B6DAB|nr:hypothetical protein [uncultured Roseobacter sp.]
MFETPQSVFDEATLSGNAQAPKIITLTNGNMVVAYAVPSGDFFRIKGQLLDPLGQPISDEFTFDFEGHRSQEPNFDMTETPDGRLNIITEVKEFRFLDFEIATMMSMNVAFDGNGNPDVIDRRIHFDDNDNSIFDFDRDDSTNPTVTIGPDGSASIFYIKKDKSENFEVFETNRTGARDDGIKAFRGNENAEVRADTLENGNIILILDRDGKGNGGEINYRILRENNSTVNIGETGDRNVKTYDSTVTALKCGGFVIAWTEDDGFDIDVQFQLFNASGQTRGGTVNVGNSGDGARDNNNEPSIVPLLDGGFIVFYDKDAGNIGVFGQRYDASGDAVGEIFEVTDDNGANIDATLTNDGRIAVTWQDVNTNNVNVTIISVDATNGDDVLDGTNGDDVMRGLAGDDVLRGGGGDDEIRGDGGDDVIIGGKGDDRLFGGTGSDIFVFEDVDGDDDVVGFNATNDAEKIDLTGVSNIEDFADLCDNHMRQDGSDVVIDTGSGQITLHSVNIEDLDEADFILSFNAIRGTEGDDTLTGTDGADAIRGLAGDDVINGGKGDDLMRGGLGSDEFTFKDGDGVDEIRRFDATDNGEKIDLTGVSAITDFTDLVQNRMTQVGDDVVVDLGDGNSVKLTGVDIDDLDVADFRLRFATINGTERDETLTGTENSDVIRGKAGDDVIIGGKGDDVLFGGTGSDTFAFADGDGNDEIRGFNATDDAERIDLSGIAGLTKFNVLLSDHMRQVGDDVVIDFDSGDTITLRAVQLGDLGLDDFVFRAQTIDGTRADDLLVGGDGDDKINGFAGDDEIYGGGGNDIIRGGSHYDTIHAGAGDDQVWGDEGRDTVFLGDGNDVFWDAEQDGRHAHDTVFGGAGNDTFHGAGGNDVFDGGKGDDLFFAGAGDETFVFADGFGNDTIVGFGADDVIDLSAVSSIENSSDLTADHLRQDGENLIIDDLAGNTITLEGINILDLSGDNFLF